MPTGVMRPPFLKHCIQSPNANPPHAPIKYLVAFQKKTENAPPMIPAMEQAKTNMPWRVLFGGLMAGRMPNLTIRTKQTNERV